MKEKEKDFDTLASDILIELYNDIKEHETDLMEEGNLDAAQDEMIRLAQSGENPHTALPGVARKYGIDVAVLKKAIFGENEEDTEKERRYEDKWDGEDLNKARKKPGGSNAGKYLNVDKDDFCGAAGGSASGSYPVEDKDEAESALSLAYHAKNPEGIKRCVYKKAKEHNWKLGAEEDENLSAKKARAGEDIGEPGKNFAKIAKSAGEKYGSKAAGKRVAGAVLAKMRGKR